MQFDQEKQNLRITIVTHRFCLLWRRRGDSNPRTVLPAYSLSRGAPYSHLGTSACLQVKTAYLIFNGKESDKSNLPIEARAVSIWKGGSGAVNENWLTPPLWRREWDSNPRLLRVTGFQDQLLKPLGHLSEPVFIRDI